MEINKRSDDIGVAATEDITEGRMVLLTSNPGVGSDLTGKLTDVPGVKLPDDSTESAQAKFCLTWPADNREPPIVAWPAFPYALRQGFDQAANAPITGKTIYLTYPGYQDSVVIPSGTLSIAMAGGVYTVPSGQYVYSAALEVPGAELRACNTADDSEDEAGMLAAVGGGTAVAVVERFNGTTYALTFRTMSP